MRLINFVYLNETVEVVLISPVFQSLESNVTESTSVFLKFESVSHDLILSLISFMAENACSHIYVVPKLHINLWANILGHFHRVMIVTTKSLIFKCYFSEELTALTVLRWIEIRYLRITRPER